MGDVVTINFINSESTFPVEVHIVGMLQDGAKVPGLFQPRTDSENDTYNLFYYPYSYEMEEQPLMLFSYAQLASLENSPLQGIYSSVLIRYPDTTEKEILEQDQKSLATMGCAFSTTLQEMDGNNKIYLYQQLYQLLPIAIVLLVLVMVGSISSSALATRKRLHNYAVYSICGLPWKHCVWINMLQSLVMCACSLAVSAICVGIITLTPLRNVISIVWSPYLLLSGLGIILFYLLISMLMPLVIIGRNTPKQVLTR